MCKFCDTVYTEAQENDIIKGIVRNKEGNLVEEFISKSNDPQIGYSIVINTGDPYETGYLFDIKFCPYCGRRLEG